jgi:F-type H+-transporting ATPase subunit a
MIRVLTRQDCTCINFAFPVVPRHQNYTLFQFFVNKLLPTFIFLSGTVTSLQAADGAVSPSPYHLTEVLGLPLTNSIVTTWAISIVFILFIRWAVGSPKLIPGKGQAVVESLIEGLRGLLLPIVGKKAFPMTFPLLIGLFIYILIHNWSGLIPGVGVFGHVGEDGHFNYWMRPANADLNSTFGMALVAMIAWLVISLKVAGPKFFNWEIFGNKADKK